MELRVLRYFVAVAKEQSILQAANSLFITQPGLSRQMQQLEKEVGCPLFVRGSRKITLTEAGRLLYKRAEEILELYNKTEAELKAPPSEVRGDVYIGAGESYALQIVAEAAERIRRQFNVRFHLFSGDMDTIKEKLDKGLIEFGIFIEPYDLTKYDYLPLPLTDTWGILMRKDSPLAQKESVSADDLVSLPLICSRHSLDFISQWSGRKIADTNVAATYDLLYNASLLVEAGVGYAVTLDKLINTTGGDLCFKPLFPELKSHLDIAWKKFQVFPRSAELFLSELRNII